jgi:hypothetical protein
MLVGGCVRIQRSGTSVGFVVGHDARVEEVAEEFVSIGGVGMIAVC